ncbi:MAG TPA: hypothetical protein VET66_06450 [Steroidobacteraceae bacterium]|nr:hypothetical protein [Steroidobacteraceae bacterium]
MPRPHWPLLLLLALRPLAGAAAVPDVDVPALGLSIMRVPPGTSAPQVSERPDGYEMRIELGVAVMRIFRESGAVPAGSDVASPSYRARLDSQFAGVESATQGAPTAVGGHGAWTVVDAHAGANGTAYTLVTYVIVDQHLYRMTVNATGNPRPPEFDGLVKSLSGVSFQPLGRT